MPITDWASACYRGPHWWIGVLASLGFIMFSKEINICKWISDVRWCKFLCFHLTLEIKSSWWAAVWLGKEGSVAVCGLNHGKGGSFSASFLLSQESLLVGWLVWLATWWLGDKGFGSQDSGECLRSQLTRPCAGKEPQHERGRSKVFVSQVWLVIVGCQEHSNIRSTEARFPSVRVHF